MRGVHARDLTDDARFIHHRRACLYTLPDAFINHELLGKRIGEIILHFGKRGLSGLAAFRCNKARKCAFSAARCPVCWAASANFRRCVGSVRFSAYKADRETKKDETPRTISRGASAARCTGYRPAPITRRRASTDR